MWIGKSLVQLGLGKRATLYLGILIVFVYCSVNLTGMLSLVVSVAQGTFEPNNLRILLLEGANPNLHSSMAKILNINTMNIAIAVFAAAFVVCLGLVDGKFDLISLVLISACGIIGLACLQ